MEKALPLSISLFGDSAKIKTRQILCQASLCCCYSFTSIIFGMKKQRTSSWKLFPSAKHVHLDCERERAVDAGTDG